MKYVYTVAKQIAENVEKDCLIVIKLTVFIGTNDKIELYIKENFKNKVNMELVSNQEFLAQGTAIKGTIYAKRIVIGIKSQHAADIMKRVYENLINLWYLPIEEVQK